LGEAAVPRDDVYEALRQALLQYSEEIHSGDLAVVAIDMELTGGASWDPAYKVWFDELARQAQYSRSQALLLCARFFSERFVSGQHIADADRFVDALVRAATESEYRPAFLAAFA
jgi:hypothetical protein